MSSNTKIDLSSGLALIGAVLLLVSLFLDWFEPGLTGWNLFEALDLVLAALALGAAAIAAGRADRALPSAPRWLPVIAGAAFVIVAVQLIDPPLVAGDGDRELGAWMALAATVLMVAGAALAVARVSVVVDVSERDLHRPGPAVGSRDEHRRARGEPSRSTADAAADVATRSAVRDPKARRVSPRAPLAGEPERTEPYDPLRDRPRDEP